MLSARFAPWHVPLFALKYAYQHVRRFPILVHFEVTTRCNARCAFCDYWKTEPDARAGEVERCAAAARFFNPIMITFTGGEPLLRRDLEELVAGVARAVRLRYLTMITHGAMLSVERALSLWDAGLNQFNISLDFPDARHDRARGIPGLAGRIFDTVDGMQGSGIDSIRFNTVMRSDNLDELLAIAERARALRCGVSYSVYTTLKNGHADPRLGPEHAARVDDVVAALLAYKRAHRGVIVNSDHYLRQIPRYVRGEAMEPCRSGVRTIHVDPRGMVRRCPDFPADAHWTAFRRYRPIDCQACYYACRGEAQAPLTLGRVRDVMA
ncbi:MAG TPA: radical SAM protein [Gemmatimonadaceae bacterium]|nr:radical SAM protein [Gemmatimonadaceae bacterium]